MRKLAIRTPSPLKDVGNWLQDEMEMTAELELSMPDPQDEEILGVVAGLVDLVVDQELKEKRAENKKKKYAGRRDVKRFDPITPKVTRSGRKFADRTSIALFKKRRQLVRKSILNRQSTFENLIVNQFFKTF